MINDNIIFLDIDGVLNRFPPKEGDFQSFPPNTKTEEVTTQSLGWLPVPVSVIRDFVLIKKCKIVISSSWRHELSPEQVEKGLDIPSGSVIGKTKLLMGGRGKEIEQWRKDFDHQGPFVIIDDNTWDIVSCESLMGHTVKTDTAVGLIAEHIPQIVEALKE